MAVRRIAVFRALNLGDMLCAVPALRTLRKGFPDADIALIGLPWAAAFQRRYAHYIDRFFCFPGYPGLPEARAEPGAVESFFLEMQAQRFDLCLQMHGSGPTSNAVVERLGGRVGLGLGDGAPASTMRLWPYPKGSHELVRSLHLLEQGLGLCADEDWMEFPLRDEDWQELQAYPDLNACLDLPFVCLHPGAREASKRWPPQEFAKVGDALADRGFHVVLTGNAAERPLAREVAGLMRHPVSIAACDISIGGLAALLSRARLLVSNDTGVAHVASALGLPSVVIFFATDPRRWGPPANGPHIVVSGEPRPQAEDVIAEALDLLAATCD